LTRSSPAAKSSSRGPPFITAADVGAPIDANGNLTVDGTRTFEWDAADRLLSVTEGSDRYEVQYDGLGRRSRVIRKTDGSTVSDLSVMWCVLQVCEERDSGGTVHRRRMARGEQVDGTAQWFRSFPSRPPFDGGEGALRPVSEVEAEDSVA
jgi:YD repeat-containing protein